MRARLLKLFECGKARKGSGKLWMSQFTVLPRDLPSPRWINQLLLIVSSL